jgi:hypothetical protein
VFGNVESTLLPDEPISSNQGPVTPPSKISRTGISTPAVAKAGQPIPGSSGRFFIIVPGSAVTNYFKSTTELHNEDRTQAQLALANPDSRGPVACDRTFKLRLGSAPLRLHLISCDG